MQGYSGNTVVRKPDPNTCTHCGHVKVAHIQVRAVGQTIYLCPKYVFAPQQ